jgi:tripartite-type tricarboxylate transporter receptor subunit TctC
MRLSSLAAALLALLPAMAAAETPDAFYRGKQITLIVGDDATGQYVVNGRLLAQHIVRHIPGQPSIIVQAMPGSSSVAATNYLYEVARRDGTVFGLPNKSVALFEASHLAGVRYKSAELNWIGSMSAANNVVVVLASTGVRTLADAKRREVIMGAQGVSGTLAGYPLVLNHLLGTKFKLVLGYAGANLINLAMDRGEVEGRGSYTWTDLKASRPEWLEKHSVNILVQIGVRKEPDLPDVPLFTDLGHDAKEREILTFIASDTLMGRPFFFPPKVPAALVAAMRQAFDETMTDPAFLADAAKLQTNIQPVSGAELQEKVAETVNAPTDIVAAAERWMTPD